MGLVDPHLPPVVHHCLGQTCWEQPSANQGLQVVVWKCGGSPQTQLTESDNTCMCTCTTRALYIHTIHSFIHTYIYTYVYTAAGATMMIFTVMTIRTVCFTSQVTLACNGPMSAVSLETEVPLLNSPIPNCM